MILSPFLSTEKKSVEKKPVIVSIIPARGGSKGVPRKNIRLLNGKPLISYAIAPSLGSKLVDYTFVVTDDKEIAAIANRLGSEVIPEPPELAQDNIPDLPVLQFAIKYLESEKKIFPNLIVFLRPTQPLRTTTDIDRCIKKAIETTAGSVHTVHLVREHPYWMNTLEGEDLLNEFVPGGWNYQQRQALPTVYKSNGLVDVMTRDLIMIENKKRCPNNQRAVIVEADCGVDIDSEFDLTLAEHLLAKKKLSS